MRADLRRTLPWAAGMVLLLLGAMAAWYILLGRSASIRASAAELVPKSTFLLLEMPNIGRSAERWQHTGLAALWAEPQVKTFIERSRANADFQEYEELLARGARTRPAQAFLA